MKNLKLLVVALVAMLGFTACNKDCGHDFIEHDFTKELVGTWTYVQGEQAEAIEIKADGTFAITGVMIHGALYEEKGTIKVVNNKVTLAYDSGDVFEGRLELVAGKSLSIVLFEEDNIRLDYDYCAKDLSEEIVGMWVYNDVKEAMRIHTFDNNGSATFTGWSEYLGEFSVLENSNYRVVGDLVFQGFSNEEDSFTKYIAAKLIYAPNGTAHGDIMTFKSYSSDGTESVQSWLRVKQTLDLAGKKYDYISAYVSNVKGKDEDFSMLGHTFNMANIKGHNFDMMFRSELFSVDLNANSITQRFRANGRDIEIVIPITVDDNKVTLDLSAENPAYRKVDMYMFQDADNSQLHMYMHTNDFINYFANMELYNLLAGGEITADNTAAIEKVYADMEARIESINVSFVFKARK